MSALRITRELNQRDRDRLEARRIFGALRHATPEQAAFWIDQNVTDLATAKEALRRLAAAVAYLSQRTL